MNKFLSIGALVILATLPMYASAVILDGGSGGDLGGFAMTTLMFIQSYVIPFILSIGFLFFVWGMFLYFIKGGHSDEAQESGKKLMAYAIAGFVVILSFWGIVNLLSNGIGLQDNEGVAKPELPGV